MKYLFLLIVVVLGGFFLWKTFPRQSSITHPIEVQKEEVQGMSSRKEYSQPPALSIDTQKKYKARLTTNVGEVVIDLFASETPVAVNNFVFLAREGFYNGVTFHRVIKGFMIQGGDPKGDGTGGPGYQFPDEPVTKDYTRGTVAMANAGPNTNGSQFFIMHQDYDLPKNYVIFGQVAEGIETVDTIAESPVESSGFETSKPVTPTVIETVEIEESQ